MTLSISNNDYILKVGDLIKFIKEVNYVGGRTIKVNSYYFINEIWDETNGNIVLKDREKNKETELFSIEPSYVNKVLNYK